VPWPRARRTAALPRAQMSMSRRTALSYGVGHVFNDLSAACWYTYLLVYLTKVAGLSHFDAGLVLLCGHCVDAVSTPCVGVATDRCVSRYGRRKSWHLVGTLAAALGLPFVFRLPFAFLAAERALTLGYYVACVTVFQLGWAAQQTTHLALVPELTSDQDERVGLNSLRYAASILSTMAVYVVAWILLTGSGGALDGSSAAGSSSAGAEALPHAGSGTFSALALLVTGAGVLTSIVFHCGLTETRRWSPIAGLPTAAGQTQRRLSLSDWLRQPSLYLLSIIYTSSRVLVNISQTYLPLYLLNTLGMRQTAIATVPLVMYGGGFLSTALVRPLNRKLGRVASFLLGSIIAILSLGTFHAIDHESTEWAFGAAFLLGTGCSIVLPTVQTMAADLITAERTEDGATAFGIISFFDKIANGCIIMSIQALHPSCNCSGGAYFRTVLTWVPAAAVALAVAGIAVKCVFRLQIPLAGDKGADSLLKSPLLQPGATTDSTTGDSLTALASPVDASVDVAATASVVDSAESIPPRDTLSHASWSNFQRQVLGRTVPPASIGCLSSAERTPKVYVIHDNPVWVEDLRAALESIHVQYEEWVIGADGVNGVAVDMSQPPPPGVFFNRVSPSSHIREKRYACEYTLALLHWLEAHGCRVIDGEDSHEHSVSKVAAYAQLQRCGVRVPRTIFAMGREQMLAAAQNFSGTRFLSKVNRGGSGAGVVLFDSVADFEKYVDSEDFVAPVDGITLIQQFVEPAEPVVTRVELVGSQLLYGLRILTDAEFNPQNCPADSCAGTNCPLSEGDARARKFTVVTDLAEREPELVAGYLRFMACNAIEICGIEFAKDAEGLCWSYDVNVNTNYNRSAERRAGIEGAGSMAVATCLGGALDGWLTR
jgi:Na+/melibiose symporter-like transporter/glutathione synthase/RimK-type ligase-like ATP-grasp enzyme